MATLADLLTMAGKSGGWKDAGPGMNAGPMFTNSGDIDADNAATETLRLAQKYDPNAHVDDAGQIIFDRSLLPQATAPQLQNLGRFNQGDKGGGFYDAYAALTPDGKGNYTGNGGADVNDLSKVIHDPNYGDVVAKQYMGQAEGDSTSGAMGQLCKYAPAAVAAIMSMGMGAAAGPLIGAAMSGAIGPGGIGDKLAMGEPIDWGKTATNAGISALGGALGSGMGNILPSGVTDAYKAISPYISIGRGIYGASKGNAGAGLGAGVTLAQLLNSGGSNG